MFPISYEQAGMLIGAAQLLFALLAFLQVDARLFHKRITPVKRRSRLVLVLLIGGLVFSGYGFYRTTHPEEITPENVETKVRSWLDAFSLKTKKITDNPKLIFGYAVDFADGQLVGVSRTKAFDRYLTFEITVELSDELQKVFDNLSDEEKVSFLKELRLEILRNRVRGGMDAPFKNVVIVRLLPITSTLNEGAVIDAIDEVHNCGLLMAAVIRDGIQARVEKKEVKRP